MTRSQTPQAAATPSASSIEGEVKPLGKMSLGQRMAAKAAESAESGGRRDLVSTATKKEPTADSSEEEDDEDRGTGSDYTDRLERGAWGGAEWGEVRWGEVGRGDMEWDYVGWGLGWVMLW